MKFIILVLSLTTFSAIGQSSYKDVFGEAHPEVALNLLLERVKTERAAMTFGEQLAEKRKIEEYIDYVYSKKSSTKVPSYEEFKKNPVKYYYENFTYALNNSTSHPNDSLESCKKTALEVIVCPEGAYTFSGAQSGIESSDALRSSVKEGLDKESTPRKKASSGKQ